MIHERPGSRYRNYLLFLLTIILAFNFVDRLVLGIVLQDVKVELGLTDTQLGLMTGIAFALFYSVLGIPIARWADRGNRATIITLTTAVWSVAATLCGTATSFAQLLLIRVGVAVGEAGCQPPAQSLISDYFNRAERPRAISRYLMGASVALIVGYASAGWLNQLYGWRMTFIILGLPGVLLAALARFTIREPRRAKISSGQARAGQPQTALAPEVEATFKQVWLTLWANKTFRHLLFGYAAWSFFSNGMLQWQPAFFIRTHGLGTGEIGLWFSVVFGVTSGVGFFLGGEWATRYAGGNERLQLFGCAILFAVLGFVKLFAYIVPNYYLAFLILAVVSLGSTMGKGPLFSTVQTLVPPRMRAMAIALVFLFANLIGVGLGPLAVGSLSDALQPRFGNDSLRYAMAIVCTGCLWPAWHLWRASRTVTHDLKVGASE